jgi:hypothetical protein
MKTPTVVQDRDGRGIVNDDDDDDVFVGAWTTREDNRSGDSRRV